MKVKVSGAIAIPKARLGMCPSLAEPDSVGFPKSRIFCDEIILLGKPVAYGSAESLRCLPVCCSPVVVLSELLMSFS